MRALLCLIWMCSTASADVIPLSKLPSQPAPIADDVPIPEHTVARESDRYDSDFETFRIAPPYCGVGGFGPKPLAWLQGDGELDGQERDLEVPFVRANAHTATEIWLERLIETDGHPELERFRIANGDVPALARRSQIALLPVGHVDDTTVYAYRRDKIVFVAMRVSSASVRLDSDAPYGGAHRDQETSCNHAITQLRLGEQSSQIAQIQDSKRCVRVDASISKTSRDPEPLLAVTARRCR